MPHNCLTNCYRRPTVAADCCFRKSALDDSKMACVVFRTFRTGLQPCFVRVPVWWIGLVLFVSIDFVELFDAISCFEYSNVDFCANFAGEKRFASIDGPDFDEPESKDCRVAKLCLTARVNSAGLHLFSKRKNYKKLQHFGNRGLGNEQNTIQLGHQSDASFSE